MNVTNTAFRKLPLGHVIDFEIAEARLHAEPRAAFRHLMAFGNDRAQTVDAVQVSRASIRLMQSKAVATNPRDDEAIPLPRSSRDSKRAPRIGRQSGGRRAS